MHSRFIYFFPFLMILFGACDRQIEPLQSQQNTLRISCEEDPQSLDPRQVRDLPTTTLLHLLYEGLTRNQADGTPGLALAETVTISPDQKTYTFKLRQSAWSDGQPVTAYDFEKSWKASLSPQFPSPNAYQLYVIKNAQAAKEGRVSLHEIGIYALDKQILVVELENPTPYFLHLTATHFFYPVSLSLQQEKEPSDSSISSSLITNGPFKLESWSRNNQLVAIPNEHYWDRSAVQLDKIVFVVLDNPTTLELFKNEELEWTGSPLSTISIDALSSLKQAGNLQVNPAAGIHLFRINTSQPPFDQVKIRQAFALALNRNELVEHVLQGNQKPAMGLVPPSMLQTSLFFQDASDKLALQLFKEALRDNHLTLQNFPAISLCYATGERSHKIAQVAQQQWKEVLGVTVRLQSCESKVYFDRLKNQNYQLGIGSWYADFNDPISFLEVFKFKNNGTNNTHWENDRYIDLLTRSSRTINPRQRKHYLQETEKLLTQEMPIVPLFYAAYNYVKHPRVKGIYFSELGYLDFKQAYLE